MSTNNGNGKPIPLQVPAGTQVMTIALTPDNQLIISGQMNSPQDALWMLKLAEKKFIDDATQQPRSPGLIPAPPGLHIPRA
jgi:hypothetical protein